MSPTARRDFLSSPARQAAALEETAHRPWPLPEGPWLQAQTWEDACFAHWRVDADGLRALVPAPLELETFDGAAWLGIVPCRVSGLRLRGAPPLPFASSFPQLAVRTYVELGGRPGIWILSLDAGSRLAAEAARRVYRLPCRHARMSMTRREGLVRFESSRPEAVFSARYGGLGEASTAVEGSFECFLTERYCLYTAGGDALYRAELHHRPWQLRRAEAAVELNTAAPVELPEGEPLLHYADRQDVLAWGLDRVAL